MKNKSQIWFIIVVLNSFLTSVWSQSISKVFIQFNSHLDGKLLLYNSQFKLIDSVELDSSKVSTMSFEIIDSDFYFIAINNNNKVFRYFSPYFLSPSDSLIINYSENNYSISGNAALVNQFTKSVRYNIESINYQKRLYLSPLDAAEIIDSVRNEREIYLSDFVNQIKVPDKFIFFHKERIYQKWCLDYLNYLAYHNYYSHGKLEYLMMDSLPLNLKDSLVFNQKFNFTETYSQFLRSFIEYRFFEIKNHLPDSIKYKFVLGEYFKIIENEFKDLDVAIAYESFASDMGVYMCDVNQNLYFETITRALSSVNESNSDYLKYAFDTWYSSLQKISIQKIAPNFTLKDLNDNNISLSDYRGKIVYLNFWGTWCPPCLATIPNQIELHHKYKNNNDIVFINVALEYGPDEIERWKNFVLEKGYTGVHLVAEKQFHNKSLSGYMINAAPTYMIIGKYGEIIETRAKPPYDNIEQIDQLLKAD